MEQRHNLFVPDHYCSCQQNIEHALGLLQLRRSALQCYPGLQYSSAADAFHQQAAECRGVEVVGYLP